jgi:magnesium chelatase family protein
MLAAVRTFILDGVSARPIRIEVDVHRGMPSFTIVGLPDAAVRDARERVRAAMVNCGFEFPLERIVVKLTPPGLRKEGPTMDLAIATALLSASRQLVWEGLADVAFAGELGLDGSTRPVRGALAIAEAAHDSGAKTIVVPAENGPEAALIEGIDVIPLESLRQLLALSAGDWELPRQEPLPLPLDPDGCP